MEDPEQFDGLFMTALQKGQGIQNFFDSFFGFLYRKTDFFEDKNRSWEYVDTNYKRYLKKFEEKKEKEEKRKRKEEEEKRKQKEQGATVREITAEEFERRKAEEQRLHQQKEQEKNEINTDVKMTDESTSKSSNIPEEKEEDKIAEGKMRPGPGNGGILDKYSWTQHDIKEINISIPIPSNIKGRDLIVKYDSKEILLQIKGQEPIIKGELYLPIKADTFLWSIEEVKNEKVITITFEKLDTYKWWESVVKGDKAIDTTKINPEPSKISDIEDPEMRAQIEKMMFDTRQKQMGLPSSDELKKQQMLDQFMKAHPEMDFSKAKFG
jgi:flagellar biosynthesis GTPase FlhF